MSHATPSARPRTPALSGGDDLQEYVAGRWAVRLLIGARGIRIARHTKVIDGDRWPPHGHNEFLRLLRLGHHTIRRGSSLLDGSPVIQIDYNVAGNRGPLRALVDEVEEHSPGHLVGHGVLRVGHRCVPLFRFDMRREA